MVQLVRLGADLRLWYKAPRAVHIGVLRGTTADLDGNISFEKEALYLDQLNKVMVKFLCYGQMVLNPFSLRIS